MDLETFQHGFDVETYAKEIRNYRSLFKRLLGEADAPANHAEALSEKLSAFPSPCYMSVTTEDWCGDSCCNVPILDSLAKKSGMEIRVFRGSEHPQIEKRYTDDGDDHIPVVSVWDANGEELARWIEAPARAEKQKNEWKQQRPEFMELYHAGKSDPEAQKKFAALYRTFLEEMAGWYVDGLWDETCRELVESVGRR